MPHCKFTRDFSALSSGNSDPPPFFSFLFSLFALAVVPHFAGLGKIAAAATRGTRQPCRTLARSKVAVPPSGAILCELRVSVVF
jgi:hypothetical protein